MIAIPFSCTDWSSMHEIKGLIRLEDDAIAIEYRVSYWGCIAKAKVHEVLVPLELITGSSFKEGWFADRLTIQASSLKAGETRGALDGRARLQVDKANRAASREFAALLSPGKMVEPVDELV